MKIVIAPDSYKGSLSARQAIDIIARAAAAAFPEASAVGVPIADGGEGTVETLVQATGGEVYTHRVRGPLGTPVDARWGVIPARAGDGLPPDRSDGRAGIAVIEMAQASGLTLVPDDARDPLAATSYGTGELIAHVLSRGYTEVLIGLGGSATNDGGAGMLEALGAVFTGERGDYIPACGGSLGDVSNIDLSELNPDIAEARFTVLSDVRNPLLGARGATAVFGPQKGVTPDLHDFLETGMENYARVLSQAVEFRRSGEFKLFGAYALHEAAGLPGAGAAGGLGFALVAALGAQIQPGIETILELIEFERHIADAALVITGEGRLDGQSLQGKVVEGVAKRCARRGVPLLVLAGSMENLPPAFYREGGVSVMTCARAAEPVDILIERAEEYLYDAAVRAFALMRMGRNF